MEGKLPLMPTRRWLYAEQTRYYQKFPLAFHGSQWPVLRVRGKFVHHCKCGRDLRLTCMYGVRSTEYYNYYFQLSRIPLSVCRCQLCNWSTFPRDSTSTTEYLFGSEVSFLYVLLKYNFLYIVFL